MDQFAATLEMPSVTRHKIEISILQNRLDRVLLLLQREKSRLKDELEDNECADRLDCLEMLEVEIEAELCRLVELHGRSESSEDLEQLIRHACCRCKEIERECGEVDLGNDESNQIVEQVAETPILTVAVEMPIVGQSSANDEGVCGIENKDSEELLKLREQLEQLISENKEIDGNLQVEREKNEGLRNELQARSVELLDAQVSIRMAHDEATLYRENYYGLINEQKLEHANRSDKGAAQLQALVQKKLLENEQLKQAVKELQLRIQECRQELRTVQLARDELRNELVESQRSVSRVLAQNHEARRNIEELLSERSEFRSSLQAAETREKRWREKYQTINRQTAVKKMRGTG